MPKKITRNGREIEGLLELTIAGESAEVVAQPGSRLDGILYYESTRGGNPRLGLQDEGQDKPRINKRFGVSRNGDGVYSLAAIGDLQS